jgi:hypothetical protein
MESIDGRYCCAKTGVKRPRDSQFALSCQRSEDWHGTIPRHYENDTHRQLEEVVKRCDQ